MAGRGYFDVEPGSLETPTGPWGTARAEMTWEAKSPAATTLRFTLFDGHPLRSGEIVARGDGTSPLVVDIPPENVSRVLGRTVFLQASPAEGTIAVEQSVAFTLTLSPGDPASGEPRPSSSRPTLAATA